MKIDKPNNNVFISNLKKSELQNSNDVKSDLLNFSNKTEGNVWNTDFSSTQDTGERYHSIIKGVRVDPEGKIDESQFTLENLKKKYPEDKYNFYPLGDGGGFQINDKEAGPLFSVFFEDGKLSGYIEFNSGSLTTYYIKSGKVVISNEVFSDESRNAKYYDDKTSSLLTEEQYDKNQQLTFCKEYCKDGTVLRIVNNSKEQQDVETPFVDSIIKSLNSDGGDFLVLTEKILNNIDKENIQIVLKDYTEKTGKFLSQDIVNSQLPDTIKQRLCLHLEKIDIDSRSPVFSSSAVILNIDSANAEKDAQMLDFAFSIVTPDNIAYVLSGFEIEAGKNRNIISDYINSITSEPVDVSEPTAPSMPNEPLTEDPVAEDLVVEDPDVPDLEEPMLPSEDIGTNMFIDDTTIPRRSLLAEISNMDWLTQEKKDEYIDHIINCAIEHCSGGNFDDIKRDIAEHRHDMRKLEVDLVRLINRGGYIPKNTEITEPNGKLDSSIQQGSTGDCWLVAGLYSISLNPEGAKYLESLVKKDETTGNYTVTLNPNGNPYPISITPDEIKNASHLSSGDGDMRIWELAFDKYFKEQAYNSDSSINSVSDEKLDSNQYDITSDNLSTVISMLYGRGVNYNTDLMTEDFNSKDKIYNISIAAPMGMELDLPKLLTQDGESINMLTDHAYSVVGSDEDNIYLVNPHDTSKTYIVSREMLKQHGCYSLTSFDFNPTLDPENIDLSTC